MAGDFRRGALWVSIYATFVLNFCDFTRASKTRKSIIQGNFWGIPINTLFFGVIVMVMAGAQFKIDGTVIESPADIVHAIPEYLPAGGGIPGPAGAHHRGQPDGQLCGADLRADQPVPQKAELLPRRPCQRRHRPGHLALEPVQQPGGDRLLPGRTGALLGPLFGVIIADYWLLRRTKINVPELYTEDPAGTYYYRNGFNPRAIAAFIPAAILSLLIAFIRRCTPLRVLLWFFGAGIGALTYLAVADRKQTFEDVSAS